MVAGENAEAAGIIRDRFVKTELSREICDRPLDRRARPRFSIRVLAREIISEDIVDLFQFPEKNFVLRELFQTRLPRELEHSDRIVIGPVPQIGIEMSEKPAGRRLPRPPKIERHFPKRLERRRKSRDYIINLKRRHWRKRKLIEKFPGGKFLQRLTA